MTNRFPALTGPAIASAFVVSFLGQPAFAQTTDFAIEVPGVRNFVAAAVGVVPDYLGSDDYTFGAAPAGVIRFGDTDRYLRLDASANNRAMTLCRTGRNAEALGDVDRSVSLDPGNAGYIDIRAHVLAALGRLPR